MVEVKEEIVRDSFSSRECLLFLPRKLFTLLHVIPSVLLVASFQLRSHSQLSQVYSHTNFLFEYINFLKVIDEEESFVI